jgi:hypothetical protein
MPKEPRTRLSFLLALFLLGEGRAWPEPVSAGTWSVPYGERRAVLTESGEGDQRPLVLENGFLRAVVSPAQGGRVVSLVHKKSGQELTVPPTETSRGGLLSDQVWQQDYWHGDWNRSAYACEIVSKGPDEAKVRMSCRGPRWDHVTIHKTVAVRNGRCVLEADYELVGGKTSLSLRGLPDFWFHQTLASPGRAFLPSPAGVLVRPAGAERESWAYDPTRGWVGYVSDKGAGMVGIMDFARLRCLRAQHRPDRIVEWIFRRVDLKPGDTLKTPVRLGFFAGLKDISAACPEAALGLSVGEPKDAAVPVTVTVAALADLSAQLALSVARLPDGADTPAGNREVSVKADETGEFAFSVPAQGEGTFVIRGTLKSGDKALAAFEREVVIGKPSGVYAMRPEAPAVPEQPYESTKLLIRPFDLDFSSLAVPTPHFQWCKPSAAGRPRVLALVNDRMEREVIELAQRFDIELTTCLLTNSPNWQLGDGIYLLSKETMDAHVLKQLGRKWDLIIVRTSPSDARDGTDTWSCLSETARQSIARMVKEGTGLWLTKALVPMEIDQATPFEPRLEGDEVPWVTPSAYTWLRPGALGSCGEGRTVLGMPLTSQFKADRSRIAMDHWEYQYALLGHLLYWAAGIDLPVTIDSVHCTRRRVSVRLSPEADHDAKVHVRLRDKFGKVLLEKELDARLAKGKTAEASLDLGHKEGSAAHVADVRVSHGKGVLTWGAETFPEPKSAIVKWQPDQAAFPREQARLTASITGDLPAGAKLRVELTDWAARLIDAVETPAEAKTAVTASLERATGFMFEARATLCVADETLDQAVCEGLISPPEQRRPDAFRAYFWGGAGLQVLPPHLVYDLYAVYRDVGVNANWGDKYPGLNSWAFDRLNMAFEAASVGMRFQGLAKQDMEKNPEAKGGIGDPATAVELRKRGVEVAQTYKDRNVFVYGCADENPGPGPDVSFSAPALAEFRRWLRDTQYPSLEALNAEWKTNFESWDHVMPMTEAEAKGYGAKTGSYAAWADQRQFNKWSYASFAKAFVEGVRSVDPDALVGDSGTQESSAYSGRDYWLLARAYTALSAYDGTQTYEQMVFNPALIRHAWLGYNKDNPRLRHGMWACVSEQNYGFGIFVANSYIDPDYTLPMHGRELKAALEEMNRGPAQMLVSAKRVRDPVFVLQSPASIHGAYITGKEKLHRDVMDGLRLFLADLAVAYQPISYQQLAEGKLAELGARVLILPDMLAMSESQCKHVREWVNGGGILVADIEPGTMTEHCRLLEKGQLDDLFGIDRSQAALTEGKWSLRPAAAAANSPAHPAGVAETGLRSTAEPLWTAATPDGKPVPVVYHRKVGKGQTFYLACDAFAHYGSARAKALNAEESLAVTSFQALFDGILLDSGVKPPVRAAPRGPGQEDAGRRCPFVNLYAKDDGATRYYTVIRDVSLAGLQVEDTPAKVTFDREGYIYDVLSQRLLGWGNAVDLVLTKHTVRLFAVLPYRVDGLKLNLPGTPLRPGDSLGISARLVVTVGQPPGRHWLRMDVVRPDGQPDRAYSDTIEAKDGLAELSIPFALNDPPGEWAIGIQDVATGTRAKTALHLEPGTREGR